MRREMHPILLERIGAFLTRVSPRMLHGPSVPLTAQAWVTDDPVSYAERLTGDYRPIRQGELWGSAWQNAWFRITGRVPAAWAGLDVVARLHFNSEALVFDAEGCPLYGLTNSSVFDPSFAKDTVRLFLPAEGGETVDLWVEASATGLQGLVRDQDAPRGAPIRHGSWEGRVKHLELSVFNTEFWHFRLDMAVLFSLYEGLNPEEPRAASLLLGMNRALDVWAEADERVRDARKLLRGLMLNLSPNPADLNVIAVGHAHLDTGWLWPVSEGIRKAARSFATQIHLIERYPEYIFGASQAQHYAFVKDHYPALYAKVKQAVADGRWECQGAMWVEADCNIPSGESLVRQVLYGKRFFKREFGLEVRNCWIPDVFGYSPALPQILRRAGVDCFLTQKLSWSKTNRFPHNTFRWRGIDGSEIVTHFPPENTYNGSLSPKPLILAQRRFAENGRIDSFISLFGIGDGGGGPTEDHLEQGLRLRQLNGCPRVSFGPAETYFETLRARAADLDVWSGELYLECHRGTLTTQARTKRGNRKLELALRETEMLLALLPAADYPRTALDKLWQALLINQFHDILPGSSIRKVYARTESDYAEALDACGSLQRQAAAALFTDDPEALVLLNSLSTNYSAPFRLPADWRGHAVSTADGQSVVTQADARGCLARIDLPPLSLTTLRRGAVLTADNSSDSGPPGDDAVAAATRLVLENDLIRYEFASDGTIERIFDKQAERDWLPAGERANVLTLYVDRPHVYDAWDVELYYEPQAIAQARSIADPVREAGPVTSGLCWTLAIGDSRLVQQVRLAPDSRRLDFDTEVDWNARHQMLRVRFPTTVQAAEATFDIQYGFLRRPTHRNTSWDVARFEVVAHRYADLSNADGGVALLNDCKYGHKVLENVIDLNLLRSPTDPDPDADQGRQVFRYSLLPHPEPFDAADVMEEAARLNQPPLCLAGFAAGPDARLPLALEGAGVSLEVLKRAEDTSCHIIRLVETRGRRSSVRLRLAAGATLTPTDLMEWRDEPALVATETIELHLSPFEIQTYKVVMDE